MSGEPFQFIPGLVSIVMPSYNCERYIGAAIDSVLNQTYQNWELLICDDCSTDGSKEIINHYVTCDKRIIEISNLNNAGAAESRNKCIELARGEWISFLDSDDVWMPNKLEFQLQRMRETGSELSCTSYYEITEDGVLATCIVKPFRIAGYWKILFSGNPLGNSTVIYHAGKIGKYYVPLIKKRNDFALWLSISNDGISARGFDEPLALYRVRKSSLSAKKTKLVSYQWSLYRTYEGLPYTLCIVAMTTWCISKILKSRKQKLSIACKEINGAA